VSRVVAPNAYTPRPMPAPTSSARAVRLRAAALGLALVLAGACDSGPEAPRWIHLTPLFAPLLGTPEIGPPLRFEHPMPTAAWSTARSREGEQEWRAPRPGWQSDSRLDDEVEFEMHAGERVFERIPSARKNDITVAVGKGLFYLDDRAIVLRLPAGETPPETTVLVHAPRGGEPRDGTWRAITQEISSEGLTLFPGQRMERELDIPPRSVLRVATVARPLATASDVRLRIELDGQALLDQVALLDPQSRPTHHVLSLPVEGRRKARLAFEVRGAPCVAVFAAPMLGPGEIGTYGARPWADARPDAVLFVADTLRADMLAPYGGDPALAPRLNAFAERSVRFLESRSASTWTLPSHGSLLTGVLPTQHGLVNSHHALDPEFTTLAREFERQGYRTAAVTESVFVSRRYGLDSGFQWFEEHRFWRNSWTLAQTLKAARELLASDDGRPLFLFVHSYRVHHPYRLGDEEDDSAYKALNKRVRALKPGNEEASWDELMLDFKDEYLGLYREGVRNLDSQLGAFFEELTQGVLRKGYLAFTSDHGESFFEHGLWGHGHEPYEEVSRVPMLVYGHDLTPRDVSYGVNAVDVAPTLIELCGLTPPPLWIGRSMLSLDRERALFIHNQEDSNVQQLAVVRGDHKILVRARPDDSLLERLGQADLQGAYALDQDPHEKADLKGREAWPAALAGEAVPAWEILSRALARGTEVQADAEFADTLKALGY